MRLSAVLLLALCAAARGAPFEAHYAPAENLEAIDVGLIEDAGVSIDMAAYVLTDDGVIEALGDAADRGVAVRLYLDRGEYQSHAAKIAGLLARPGVEARLKTTSALMHMKAYAVDGEKLRTGSGNFSRSGLREQDNDLVVTDDAAAVKRFEDEFARVFALGAAPVAAF